MSQLAAVHAWQHWSFTAFAIGFFLWILYELFTGPYRRLLGAQNAAPPSSAQQIYMALGMIAYFFAFASPLDYISDNYLFSAHMIQHMVEVSIMVPLLLKGLPNFLWTWAFQWTPFERAFRAMVNPFTALIVFLMIFDNFHWPVIYDLTLTNETFHVFEHVLFFFAASFLWWPVLSTHPDFPRITPGFRLVYLFFAFDVMMPASILILMWNHPLYIPYAEQPVRLWGLSPVSDQRLGAVIMIVIGFVSNVIAAFPAFARFDMSQWYD
ncbi:cytochrome c oxidase assembly protein [Sulfobacillus harzensis]|uniref:Cytochrome c oxidase assembly protein n=1 Tax=Sulfobacillus harzensis TaxID=2729629 RepID=A0A7Y0Q378_9FIRM|nr:cytochrome c oxidase assembly protein [Sulfobacillus harzensis]NMP23120.1 cytochrome c oxidase assembly protein [Sulfobacillus harzensis]